MTDTTNANTPIFQLTAPRGGRLGSRNRFHRIGCISTHGPARGPTAILDNDPLSKIVFFILLHNFKDFSITFLYGFFFFTLNLLFSRCESSGNFLGTWLSHVSCM